MAEQQNNQIANQPVDTAERELASSRSFSQNIAELQQLKFGGYKLLETSIEGADSLNPERRAKREIFLKEGDRRRDRQALLKRLELWKEMLSSDGTVSELAEQAQKKLEATEELHKQNVKEVLDASRELEATYRGVALYFANANQSGFKVRNIVFLNAGLSQLDPANVYNNDTIEYVKNEIHQVYNRFDLQESYSLLVIPGYLGKKTVVDAWAKIASEHKLMLITDYRNMGGLKDTIKEFQREKLSQDVPRFANVMMTVNHLVGRGKYEEYDEEEDLYIEPSTALAGKIHQNLISQVSAGLQFGALEEVDGVRMNLLKTEVGELEGLGLIPMTKEFARIIPFSGKTLFAGNNVGLKTYSVVRVFDWLMKVMMNFLNKRAMENWSGKVEKELTDEIVKFLDRIKGPGRIIDKFDPPKFRPDPMQPDRIIVDLNVTPFFPAKTFIINLTGEKGRNEETGRRNDFKAEVR
ncbi:type VI secretion system contractile sheath protein TssC [Fibrella arboris]|uniref:type VI secretion system contractile sheath protein TssC n=1 Tax=Fibrella arboris TaxID=3242486 RepID=UPI0035209A2A